ncbi:AgmX/PglI C-terminal domain-containing protein [Alkalilimnicola ehrlichii]|nr:AgmX/PglI C-terminal domain-containing protein [Alkalilimnicola ehrlichii]
MSETGIPDDQREVQAHIADARQRIDALEASCREVDDALTEREARRREYSLLSDVCASLDRLEEAGAGHLFWGAHPDAETTARLSALRRDIAAFEQETATLQAKRDELRTRIERELDGVALLTDELLELQAEEEERLEEYVVERDYVPPPYRPVVMPWTKRGEDEKRLRKALAIALLFTFSLTSLMSLWTLSTPSTEVVEIPERLARLVQQEPPPPVERPEQPKPEPTPETEPEDTPVAEEAPVREAPTVAERQTARETAETAGLLAFRETFSELRESAPQANLGANARVDDAGQRASGQQAQRAVVSAQTQGGSRGIATDSISRNVSTAGVQDVDVEFARVESAIGASAGETDRPLSDGPRPSRTDEEIQIVFDRYKAALYRIYNRELRRDPTLRGKMILRITIEPDGSVSLCQVESTDLDSPELEREIVDRVRRFNFGPKEGVPSVTILYPIDFLPAN